MRHEGSRIAFVTGQPVSLTKRDEVLVAIELPHDLLVARDFRIKEVESAPVAQGNSFTRNRLKVPIDWITKVEVLKPSRSKWPATIFSACLITSATAAGNVVRNAVIIDCGSLKAWKKLGLGFCWKNFRRSSVESTLQASSNCNNSASVGSREAAKCLSLNAANACDPRTRNSSQLRPLSLFKTLTTRCSIAAQAAGHRADQKFSNEWQLVYQRKAFGGVKLNVVYLQATRSNDAFKLRECHSIQATFNIFITHRAVATKTLPYFQDCLFRKQDVHPRHFRKETHVGPGARVPRFSKCDDYRTTGSHGCAHLSRGLLPDR